MFANKYKFVALLAALFLTRQVLALNIQHWTQKNGAQVYFIATHSNPIVDLNVMFDAGQRRDNPNSIGVADMTANLLNTGAANLGEEAISNQAADLAIVLDTSSGIENAGLRLRSLSEAKTLSPALSLATQVLSQPTFDKSVLRREKKRAIEALKQSQSDPGFLASRELSLLMYPDHPYGYNARVSEQSIQKITHAQLVAFWRTHYQPRYAVISIVGDLTRSSVDKIATQLLSGLKNQGPALVKIAAVPRVKAQEKHLSHEETQANIALGMPLITRDDPDYFALVVGNYVLGSGGFDSRLMQEVRVKRGLTYGVFSSMAPMQRAGAFSINLSTRKEQASAALALVRSTVARYIKEGPSQAELDQAKANIIGGFPLRFDSNAKALAYLSVIGQYQLPLDYLERYPREVKKLTPKIVHEAWLRRIHPENISVVVVGEQVGK